MMKLVLDYIIIFCSKMFTSPNLACFRMIFVLCLLIIMTMISFKTIVWVQRAFLSWRIRNRTVSWILFLMFMSLFVMYMSPVQQIISWIRWKWCCFFLFFLFFSSLKKNDFCLAPLVFKRQVFQGTTNCCRTEQAAYVRRKQLHDVHGCLNWEVF